MLKTRPRSAPTAVLGSVTEDIGLDTLLEQIEQKLQVWEAQRKWVRQGQAGTSERNPYARVLNGTNGTQ